MPSRAWARASAARTSSQRCSRACSSKTRTARACPTDARTCAESPGGCPRRFPLAQPGDQRLGDLRERRSPRDDDPLFVALDVSSSRQHLVRTAPARRPGRARADVDLRGPLAVEVLVDLRGSLAADQRPVRMRRAAHRGTSCRRRRCLRRRRGTAAGRSRRDVRAPAARVARRPARVRSGAGVRPPRSAAAPGRTVSADTGERPRHRDPQRRRIDDEADMAVSASHDNARGDRVRVATQRVRVRSAQRYRRPATQVGASAGPAKSSTAAIGANSGSSDSFLTATIAVWPSRRTTMKRVRR